MFAALTAFTNAALVATIKNVLQGYTSEGGAALQISVRGAGGSDPMDKYEVVIQAQPPEVFEDMYVGGGQTPNYTTYALTYMTVQDTLYATVATRMLLERERDNLHDYLCTALIAGINPASGNRWKQDLWSQSGLEIVGVYRPTYRLLKATRFGDMHEAESALRIRSVVTSALATTPVSQVTIVPTESISLPLGPLP